MVVMGGAAAPANYHGPASIEFGERGGRVHRVSRARLHLAGSATR